MQVVLAQKQLNNQMKYRKKKHTLTHTLKPASLDLRLMVQAIDHYNTYYDLEAVLIE
jgi:hypothetical protein